MTSTRQKLSIKERLLTAIIYFVIIIAGCYLLSGNFDFLTNSSSPYNVIFNAYALLYVLNEYITEPYFTKPIDVIAKTISIFLILLAIDDKSKFLYFWGIFSVNLTLFLLAILINYIPQGKIQKITYQVVSFVAKPSIIASALYILALFSNFHNDELAFILLFGAWVLLVFQSPNPIEKFSLWILSIWKYAVSKQGNIKPLGEAIGYDNPFLYKEEVDFLKHNNAESSDGELVYL